MSAKVASSARAVPYSRIRELAEIAMAMDDATSDPKDKVLRLYFGESNLPTPDYIKCAATQAMADGFTFYTPNAGLPSTRQALARYYHEAHGVAIDPVRELVITASGTQALNVGIRCTLDPGDEAIVLTPAWPNGSAIVQMCNAVVREVPHPLIGDRYGIDFDALEAAVTTRTRLLIYTSPSNPLGWVATEEEQRSLLDFSRRHGIWLMADEVYERLYYEGELGKPSPSILRLATRDDALIVVQSFSKAYCMTGWRIGWIIARGDLAQHVRQLNEFIIINANTVAQRSAETALQRGEVELRGMLARLKENRDLCLQLLGQMPRVTIPKPDGAFYLFPKIAGLTDSFEFCRRLLLETKVGLAPGVAFGAGGEGSIRICYASETHIVKEALQRLGSFLS